MTDERKPKHLLPINCDRTDSDRQFLRIACVGTNAEQCRGGPPCKTWQVEGGC
jgi:hypothetical protein